MTQPPAIAFDAVSKTFGDGGRCSTACRWPFRWGSSWPWSAPPAPARRRCYGSSTASPSHRGAVRVDGADVQATEPIALRRRIGYVFQEVGLFPHLTVAENIAITPKLLGWDAARIAARVDELLDLVRLDRRHRDRFPPSSPAASASGSASPARSRPSPRIMLMDEPFGALDPITRDALGARLPRACTTRSALTTVMITHDMPEAVLLADRIVVLQDGRIVADGTPRAADRARPTPTSAS